MTGLDAWLRSRIATTGPIPLDAFMGDALGHPTLGYYATRDPLGTAGDFTTAPEISQMFGELLGLALARAWQDQGAPERFVLAEPGPGRGTLMADILRATKGVSGFSAAAQPCLIETSPVLRDLQTKTLGHAAVHVDDLGALPDGPLFLVANEFFDALPIRQFRRDGMGWSERMVGLDSDGALTFGWSPAAPLALLTARLEDTKDGDIVEIGTAAARAVEIIAARIARDGGAAMIVDYGDWHSLGDTLQAVSGHQAADPLAEPGQADLTAHVDFAALAAAARNQGVAHSRLTPQGVFLERLGITARAQALAARLSGPALDAHIAAHRRLTHPEEMGTLFKVMALFPQDAAPPPGLDP